MDMKWHNKVLGSPVLFLALSIFLMLGCNQTEIDTNTPLAGFTEYLDNRIPKLMEDYGISGTAIALVKNGEPAWSKAYGYADADSGRKMTVDTYCRVESISKSVTAWGVLKLVQEEKIELDRPLVSYLKTWKLPESEFSEEKITIRQLLSQTSGMPLGTIGVRYAPTQNKPTLREILTNDAVLFQEPNTSFSYSNTGFNLLELLIEDVTGLDFADYMEKEVLAPLAMYRSTFNWSDTLAPPVPFGYDLEGSPIPVYVYPDKAAGGLFSTVNDVARFVAAGMTNYNDVGQKVLHPKYIDSLYSPMTKLSGYYDFVFDAYGFGHFIENLPNGMTSVSNGGQGSGWMAQFQSVPETGDGIVILTNSQRSWPFFGHILNDWAEWNGFGAVGMGKIVGATKVSWAVIALLLLYSAVQSVPLLKGIVLGSRKYAPLSKKSRLPRSGQFVLSLIFMVGLWWMLGQEYFFLFSVLPIASQWLVRIIFIVALVLLASALFPKIHPKNKS